MENTTKQQGVWKSGIWFPTSNNPKGYNAHKQNLKPKEMKAETITREKVSTAYRELWQARRIVQSKAQIFSRLNKAFCGLDKIDEEFIKK